MTISNKVDKAIEKIKLFNERNNLNHGNSSAIAHGNYIYSTIEGNNHLAITIAIYIPDVIEKDIRKVIETNYKRMIDGFDIDDYFTEIWNADFAEHNYFTPREFIKMLEEDYQQFQEIEY